MSTTIKKLSEESSHSRPNLNHTQVGKINELVKSDSEKSSTILRLKKDLGDLQHVVEGIRSSAEVGLMMVQRDGPSGRAVERDTARIRGGGTTGGQ